MRLQIRVLNADTSHEINAAFAKVCAVSGYSFRDNHIIEPIRSASSRG
jgi:hypothetical protein